MTTAEPLSSNPMTTDPNSEAFYSGALDRISRFMVVLAFAVECSRLVALRLATSHWDSPAEASSPT